MKINYESFLVEIVGVDNFYTGWIDIEGKQTLIVQSDSIPGVFEELATTLKVKYDHEKEAI